MKLIRDSRHKNKCKLVRNVRMSMNVAYIDSLSKKQASPALNLFQRELTTALENEHGDMAKGTWSFFRMFNDHITLPLLAISISKGIQIKEASTFSCKENTLLKYFKEIMHWLLNY